VQLNGIVNMNEIYNMTQCSLWIAFVLYLLFETSAVYEYTRFLPNFLTKRKEYEKFAMISYGEFMRTSYDSFAMRMLTCPICIGVWLSAACAVFVQQPILIPSIYLCSQLVYRGFKAVTNWLERFDNE